MSDEQQIFLGLGSNLNDKYKNLKNGIMLLKKHPHIWVTDQSHVYQSPAMYNIDQDDFYNMVIKVETNLTPLELLKEIQSIELKTGRKKRNNKKYMPRSLDIDILVFGNLIIHSHLLEIPHPGIQERKFVLKPWNDISPDFLVPDYSAKVSDLLNNISDSSETRRVLIFDKERMI